MRMADAGRVTLDLLHLIRDAELRAEIMLILVMYVYVISTVNSILESSSLYGLSKNFVWFMIVDETCLLNYFCLRSNSLLPEIPFLSLLTPNSIWYLETGATGYGNRNCHSDIAESSKLSLLPILLLVQHFQQKLWSQDFGRIFFMFFEDMKTGFSEALIFGTLDD